MRPGRILALIAGVLLALPGLALAFGGAALGVAYAAERDDAGYFDASLDRVATGTVAVTAGDLSFSADPGSPDWLIDRLDTDVRLRVTPAGDGAVFIGIGPRSEVDGYLAGVAHDEVVDVRRPATPVYRHQSGSDAVAPPGEQGFWVASTEGSGTQELTWTPTAGRWTAVLMNANGQPNVVGDVRVGARSDAVLPTALVLLALGAILSAVAVVLVVIGVTGRATSSSPPGGEVATGPLGGGTAGPALVHVSPVSLSGQLDPELSRWLWLVKWFLAIPHFVVLAFLWIAFAILTLVAWVAILFTGRYPRSIFEFNVGVLRWSWRVSFYATSGGIGTDRYPPFSLSAQPAGAATLDVQYPERLNQLLVLVKWFLAIPHLLIVGLLAGGSARWLTAAGWRVGVDPAGGGGLLGLLVLVAGVALLFSGRYPQALFDLIVGLNRWIYRVIAYVALMTDDYPPFRLDQGGDEPQADPGPMPPPSSMPASTGHEFDDAPTRETVQL
jgi:Domain of unknown function (DUF4389)